ncbi:MAG: flagellar hook-length control protein FliK, partial [Bacteroidota bacterium]|nr:flagellar hook-length control protein FliK [Bacteroidota bacterium]
ETKQVNISQNADNQVELSESIKGDGVTYVDNNGNKSNGKIEEPQVGVVNQEDSNLPVTETTSKQEAQIIDVKQETVTSNNNTKNSNIKTENQGDLSGIKTVKQDISEETNSAATIKDKTIDTKDNTNIAVNEKPIVNVNVNKTLSNNDEKIDSPESNSGNEIAKGKVTIENSSTDNKPVISVDDTANEDNVNNIDQSADKENNIELKSIPFNSKIKLQGDKEISVKFNTQSKVNEIKSTKDDPVRVEPKVETKPTEQKIQAENTGSVVKEKTFTESQPVEQEIKTTKQFDIRLNSSKSISSLDILSKVHQFISDNAFADKPIGLSTDVSDSKSNNLNTDSSTAFLSSLNEFTKDNDISLLHNKSNFILQKQNFNNKNADSKLSNNKSEDINITAKTDTKVDNLPLNSEHNNKEQKTINENTKPEISKITAEDKILADAEEKLNQNLPVNEKKVFTPDFSLINPLTAKESSKIETVKNVNSTVKINEPVTNSTKPTTDKNSSDSSTGKETRDSNENSAFNISHTNAAEKISDKQSSIHEDIKFIPQEEKMVKYSRLMPEIKNALSEGVNKSLTLSLMPEELGRVKLMVETVDKTVTAKIEVQNEAVQTTVQNNLDNLKQSLSQAGINVNNITVSISYNENKQQKPGELKRKNSGANDKKVETENEKIANTSPSKTLGYNTYEYLA